MILGGAAGCHMIFPDISYQPVVHNPFPQLSRVAIVPFFNQSDEPTVDGRKFALAYFAELQSVPGYEVVPLGVVEEAIIDHQIDLSRAGEARRLGKILGVDAVVVGSVTDYSSYYPPRCGMRVEWYAVNPGFHEVPPGYGLPWGTPEEEFIPAPLVFEAEMALARAQMATQSPACDAPLEPGPLPLPPQNGPSLMTPMVPLENPLAPQEPGSVVPEMDAPPAAPGEPDASGADGAESPAEPDALAAQYEEEELPPGASNDWISPAPALQPDPAGLAATTGAIGAYGALPPGWPDERGFIPPGPSPVRPPCLPHDGPVMTHTRIYQGSDSEFTEALASYYHWRDDARFGGWQNYLQRSDDFIRFCCHMHISEMLSARGGAGETRVVWQWSDCR
ncbi:MAG: hypothetical protein WD468_07905 [Pirellulales bacterium]